MLLCWVLPSLVNGLAMLLELVVEEISEIEYRTVQQEIELYNVTLPELTGNGTTHEEVTKRREKRRKKGRKG